MPTNQYNTQARQQVSSQPKWYQYISPYIEGASKAMGDINNRKEAYVKAFKAYIKETADQVKNDYNGGELAFPKKLSGTYTRETETNRARSLLNQGPVRYVANTVADPAMAFAKHVAWKGAIKPFKKLGFSPDAPTLTESDYSERFLQPLDSIMIKALDNKVPDWRERTAKGDTVRVGVNGWEYSHGPYGGANKPWLYRIFNPIGQIEHDLGSFTVEATKEDISAKDIYDFDQSHYKGGVYGTLRNWASDDPDTKENEKIKVYIKRKRLK